MSKMKKSERDNSSNIIMLSSDTISEIEKNKKAILLNTTQISKLGKYNDAIILNTKQLSQKIPLPEATIRKLARTGIIPAYKVTADYLFIYSEVVEAIINNRVKMRKVA